MSTPDNLREDDEACPYPDYETIEATDREVPAVGAEAEGIERNIWDALYSIEDPEMPVSIVDLGLIYEVSVVEGRAIIDMTLTYTGCPAREMLLDEVESAVAAADGVQEADVRLVWTPDWTVDMVTERGKESLREFGLSV